MSDDAVSQTATQKSSNLARIRDNQRRSRARRKEYLQELESKFRHCEQTGVEASAEIQAAARRVVEENRRLRQLLKQQGLTDAEIDGVTGDSPQHPSAANSLEHMIGIRKPCNAEGGCGDGGAPESRRQSIQGQALQPAPVPAQVPQDFQAARPQNQESVPYASPMASNAQFPNAFDQPYGGSAEPHPTSPPHQPQPYIDPQIASLSWLDHYPTTDFVKDTKDVPHLQDTIPTTSSCYVAADVIRGIRPDLGEELEHELGCTPGNGGECSVPNQHIFNIMDRYSSGGL